MRKYLATALLVACSTTTAMAVPLEGVWTGVYTCNQLATNLELYVQRTPAGTLDARFHFGDGSPGHPVGCFAMTGVPQGDNLQLTPTHWFMRPYGFVWAALAGVIDGPVYSGTVLDPHCGGFQMVWHPPAPLPYGCS